MTLIFWTIALTYLAFYLYGVWPKVVIWRESRAFRKELNQLTKD